MKIKVGFIYGGETVEHEVSVVSAIQAMEHLNKEKYEIVPIYITKDRKWYTGKFLEDVDSYKDLNLLKKYAKEVVLYNKNNEFVLQSVKGFKRIVNTIDIFFPVVHGNNMEDGTLAGYLEMIKAPYVGSNLIGGALGQDKVLMKQVFESSNIPVVPYTWFFDTEYTNDSKTILHNIESLGYPVIVKPATLGSSVGITFVKEKNKIEEAILEAIKYDNKIVVEKGVKNLLEVNCSVLGNYESSNASVIEEVNKTDDLLSYKDKYLGGTKSKFGCKTTGSKGMASASRIIPARISDKQAEEVQKYSLDVFRVLNLSGVCRIDFLIDKDTNKVYVNEPNTCPGSLSFYLWEKTNKPYKELLDDMINLGIRNYKNKSKKTYSFDNNLLSNFANGLKGAKGKLKI